MGLANVYTENPSYYAHRLCVLSIACTNFSIGETFFPEFHSGLIWIQTVFANVNRERERERLVHAHPFGSASADRQVEREREMHVCVLFFFEFRHFFDSENLPTYFKVSCKREVGICADGKEEP